MQEAQNSKAPAQLLADRAAQWLVMAAIVIGLATFAVWFWWIGQPLLFAVTLTITVFVIACPDALGLATPMAVMVGTGLGAMNGILFKNASALEDATKLNVIVFDKTGTLTVGQPEVVEIVTAAGATEDGAELSPPPSSRGPTIRWPRPSCAAPPDSTVPKTRPASKTSTAWARAPTIGGRNGVPRQPAADGRAEARARRRSRQKAEALQGRRPHGRPCRPGRQA